MLSMMDMVDIRNLKPIEDWISDIGDKPKRGNSKPRLGSFPTENLLARTEFLRAATRNYVKLKKSN